MTQPRAPRGVRSGSGPVRTGPAESELVGAEDPGLVAYREAQVAEYEEYIAAQQITTEDGVPIYNYGDPVPVSNVKAHGYDKDGAVLRLNRKTGQYEPIKSTSDGGSK